MRCASGLEARYWQLTGGMSPSLPLLSHTIGLRVPGWCPWSWPGPEYCGWWISPHRLEQRARVPPTEELRGRALPPCSLHDPLSLLRFFPMSWQCIDFGCFYSHFPCLGYQIIAMSRQVTWITTFCILLAALLLCKIISKPDISIVTSDLFSLSRLCKNLYLWSRFFIQLWFFPHLIFHCLKFVTIFFLICDLVLRFLNRDQ